MRKLALLGAIGLAALLAWPIATTPAPAQTVGTDTCQALLQTTGDGLAVNAATLVTPMPEWRVRGGQGGAAVRTPFCRVEGMIERRVGFEMWLPTTDKWNGRMLGAGVGGDAGVFNLSDLARGVEAGFASITNDSGHKAVETHWMMRKDAVLDYTHRSQHMMNVAGRKLINAYYNKAPHHAYFMGCSGGGRQALTEMQRYPQDYDGIIAGAGGPRMPVMSVRHMWQGLYPQKNPAGAMEDPDWKIVAEAAVAACDKKDGVADGVIENPKQCKFDPAVVQCGKAKAGAACISPEKVKTVKAFYAPLTDENGVVLDDGLVASVRTRPGPPSPLLVPLFGEGAHHDMNWTPANFKPGADLALAEKEMPEMAPNNPDLSAFAKRGGRAIIYNGWLDPSIVAGQSINYYESVRKKMGDAATNEVARLYMIPGMLHCGGGDGVNQFGGWDTTGKLGEPTHAALSALVNWVENGKAPEAIIGSRVENGTVTRQRPICPYPQVAKLTGKDWKQASSYKCVRG